MPARCSGLPICIPACMAGRCGSRWIRRRRTSRRRSATLHRDFVGARRDRLSSGGVERAGRSRTAPASISRECTGRLHPRARQMSIRDGIVRGPLVGATIEGKSITLRDDVHLRGTFVPFYGLNNMFGQIPIVGTVPRRRQQRRPARHHLRGCRAAERPARDRQPRHRDRARHACASSSIPQRGDAFEPELRAAAR